MTPNILLALLLTIAAGLATGIGSSIAFFAKRTNKAFFSFSLGFSAGVMLYISFVEMLSESRLTLTAALHGTRGEAAALCSFFGGMLLVALIDKLVPEHENPHEARGVEQMDKRPLRKEKLMRVGLYTSVIIGIHNLPEGMATFMSALQDPQLGVAIAVAIAIHNIPEGIAVSVPIYHATGSRRKAFTYSFLSGITEPIGALLCYLVLMPFLSDVLFGVVFAAVAGIMVYISLDELLPAAREYGKAHLAIYGVIAGMAVMAVSLIMLM